MQDSVERPITRLTEGELATARAIIAKVKWKTTTSKRYEKCPHSYVSSGRRRGSRYRNGIN
jgi:hypothetical protein